METGVNNKCKAFTSLEQSRKLAEILPLESADMYYSCGAVAPDVMTSCKQDYKCYTICWSLAALLSVLPRFIEYKGEKYYLRFMKEHVEYANDEISITGRCLHTIGNDNLVDACYEMIIKLHKLDLL